MKIQHLVLVFFMTYLVALSARTSDDVREAGGPLPGRVKIRIFKEASLQRLQVSGSLDPLRVFVNGHDRTSELREFTCGEFAGLSLNGESIKTQGAPGIFYWEGIQERGDFTLELKKASKCFQLSFKLPLTFFDKGHEETFFVSEKDYAPEHVIVLEGDPIPGFTVKLDQGQLEAGEKWKFTHTIHPGQNLVTGVLIDEKGKITPLQFTLVMEIQRFNPEVPALNVHFLDRKEDSETQEVRGRIVPGHELLINGETVSTDAEGKFDQAVELEKGGNEIIVLTRSGGAEVETKKNVLRSERLSPPRRYFPGEQWIGATLWHAYAHQTTKDLRVTDQPLARFTYGRKFGENNFWEFFFRYMDEDNIFESKTKPPVTLKLLTVFGAVKLVPLGNGFHYGYGLSAGRVLRRNNDGDNSFKALYDLNVIGRIGWFWDINERWGLMASLSPFIAIPLGESFEKYGFEFSPVTVTYSF